MAKDTRRNAPHADGFNPVPHTLEDTRRLLADPAVRSAYAALAGEYSALKRLLAARGLQYKHFCLQYGESVKQSEFKRWLARHGATFSEGSKHTKIYVNGRQSVMPRHPSAELGESLRRLIVRQLAIR